MGKKGQLVKSVGIEGVEAPSKVCDDQNCPFHGSLRVRGLILDGILIKFKSYEDGSG
jgi:SSU ribosomal protein S17P